LSIDGALVNGNNFTGIGAGGQQVSPLADLNPNDIENIEVLKGSAASALYGPQAQNGVVKITTKRGKTSTGNEIQVNYQGIFGYNEPHKLYTADMIESWQDANRMFRQGQVQQHAVNLQGSSGVFNYFVGYENRAELGMVPQNSLNRETVRFNLDATTSKNLIVRGSASYTRNKVNRPQNDNNVLGFLGNTTLFSPYTNPSGAAGAAGLSVANRSIRPGGTYQFTDSLAILAVENEALVDRFVGSGELTYNVPFIPGLRLTASGGTDVQTVRNSAFYPANFGYAGVVKGDRQIFNFSNIQTNLEGNINYDWSIGETIKATTLVGGQAINVINTSSFLQAQNYPTELVRDLGAGDATTRSISESFQNTRILGFYARQELSLNNDMARLSGGVRLDQASQYGAEIPFVVYPQVSGMARLDKMGFLPEVINQAKVRVAYGLSGRLPTLLNAQALIWTTGQSPSGAGAIVNSAGNTAIVAERSAETEFGIDMEFDHAYGLEFTYYLQDTRGGLLNAPRAPSTGLGSKPINVGQISGWGFESKLSATFISTQETGLDVNLIVNYQDNRVGDIGASSGASEFLTDGFAMNYLVPGERRSQFMGLRPTKPRYRADGYYDFTNQPRNGVEIDTAGVRRTTTGAIIGGYSLGSSVPIFTGSLNVTFRFLNDFTFYALGEYAAGHLILNDTRRFHTNPTYANNPDYNRLATQLGIFGSGVSATNGAAAQERGPAAQLPIGRVPGVDILKPGTPEYEAAAMKFLSLDYRPSSLRIANFAQAADWIRIREVSLSWNAARTLNSIFGEGSIRKLSIGASVTNLALFTGYKGPDPEITSAPATALSQGQDFLSLMQARAVNVLVSVGF
jgi:TonB-dependent SusC/RagA subfamily outer membrane receptor